MDRMLPCGGSDRSSNLRGSIKSNLNIKFIYE